MAGRSFDQADWIIGHALQTTIPHRDECRGAPPPDLSPSTDPTAPPSQAAVSDDGSSTVAVKSEGGASAGAGAGVGLKRDPAWDKDWIRLMLYMPQPAGGDELSAIQAWHLVSEHPRRAELNRGDYGAIIEELKPKINCYGYVSFLPPVVFVWCFGAGLTDGDRFGAVVEAFEVKDALMKVLAVKDRSPRREVTMTLPGMAR
jgi:hypothetical protein